MYFKKKHCLCLFILGLATHTVNAKTVAFQDLLSNAWENQPTAKSFSASSMQLEAQKQAANTLFKERPVLEINTSLGSEKEYEVKTSFELKNSQQKTLSSKVIHTKLAGLSLEQIKAKLEFTKKLRQACWQFILSKQHLKNINQQLELSTTFKNNYFKQYKAGLVSYIAFKQIELDVFKIHKLQHHAEYEVQTNFTNLRNVSNVDMQLTDNIDMQAEIAYFNKNKWLLNKEIDIHAHPLYQHQQNLIQQATLETQQLANQSNYPITWSIGASVKQQDKKNYQVMLSAQIPIGKNYDAIQKNAEINKKLIEHTSELNNLKNQLINDIEQSKQTIFSTEKQLQMLQDSIQVQKQMLDIYAKGLKSGSIDMAMYLKNKQELFELQQQLLKHQIELDQAKSDTLQALGLTMPYIANPV